MERVLLILTLAMRAWCEDNIEFQCKPRPGCHVARCDPVSPISAKNLHKNEYTITCMKPAPDKQQTGSSQLDHETLITLFTSINKADINSVKRGKTDWSLQQFTDQSTAFQLLFTYCTILFGCDRCVPRTSNQKIFFQFCFIQEAGFSYFPEVLCFTQLERLVNFSGKCPLRFACFG